MNLRQSCTFFSIFFFEGFCHWDQVAGLWWPRKRSLIVENDLELHLRDFDSQSICPSGENAAAAVAAAPRALFPHKKSFVLIFCHSKQASLPSLPPPLSPTARARFFLLSVHPFLCSLRPVMYFLASAQEYHDLNFYYKYVWRASMKAWMLSCYTSIYSTFLRLNQKHWAPFLILLARDQRWDRVRGDLWW